MTVMRLPLGASTRSSLRAGWGLWALAVLTTAGAAIALPAFRTPTSMTSLMASLAPLLLVATGQAVVVLLGGIDLSVGAVLGLATVLVATTESVPVAVALALLAGLAAGAANGLGVLAGVNPLIMTFAAGGIVQGIALLRLSAPGGAVPGAVIDAVTWQAGTVPVAFMAAVGVLALVWFATTQARWGRLLQAAGFASDNARRLGLPVGRVTLLAYSAAGLLAAFAGLAVIARTYSGDALSGTPFVLDSVTAVLVAGIALTGGRGSVLAVLPAAVLLGVVDQVIRLTGTNTNYQFVLKGLILIAAMWLYQAARRRERP
ncbi:ABC transporter permease [Jiangella aurantiaca]|uniref:Autoinducer 2 import system permease protein LsrC n=1 Tax=Jiangella aurantiaca TaxID=2530373 RepID=A0A4R5AM38_9ACTN|nr:ABC transporter permease [Jiangella aurantiaca]TDD71252.1 ABC transporter permease [Jiangella aurantiaca]